jgi:hypothetical protein
MCKDWSHSETSVDPFGPYESETFFVEVLASPFQNDKMPMDVNGDEQVAPEDVLLLINELNSRGTRALSADAIESYFLDVDGDGFVSPSDVLQVINELNSPTVAEGEAKSHPVAVDNMSNVSRGAEHSATQLMPASELEIPLGAVMSDTKDHAEQYDSYRVETRIAEEFEDLLDVIGRDITRAAS